MLISPYTNKNEAESIAITKKLIEEFPLSSELLISIVESAWSDIYSSSFGNHDLKIGKDIFLPAQATGVILEHLIAIHLNKHDNRWRGSEEKTEKDIVCTFNDTYSFEIKTSSSSNGIYGNRSTGNKSKNSKKHRTGYYLIINYKLPKENDTSHKIKKIRFGWIDDEDWKGQTSQSGQQASINVDLAKIKLVTLKTN